MGGISAQEKIGAAVGIVGVDGVWERLRYFIGNKIDALDFEVQTDGSIHNDATGRYLTEPELEEFVDFCEKENLQNEEA